MGCLQVALDKGEREDWFDSSFIVTLSVVSVLSLLLFIFRELRTPTPIIDLRVLRNRSFAVGTVFTTIVMFGLYGTYILIPLYCQLVSGYTPFLAGQVLVDPEPGHFCLDYAGGAALSLL